MNRVTKKALKESIAHWRRLATGTQTTSEDIGSENCALCMEFLENDCRDCPIRRKTGRRYCSRSPYDSVEKTRMKYGLYSKEFRYRARQMLAFLERLLPKRKNTVKL